MKPHRRRPTRTPCRGTRTGPLLAALLLVACEAPPPEPPGPGPQDPVPVPIGASQSQVMNACMRTEDFVTDAGMYGGPMQIATGVTVRIYPRKASSRNRMAQLAAGNIIARIVKTGDQPYSPWALAAGSDTSCWMVGQRPNQPAISRFVSRTMDVETSRFTIVFRDTPSPDSAAIHNTPLPGHAHEGTSQPTVLGGLFRPATFIPPAVQISGGHAWSTCITNGCCMAGF